MSNNPSHTDVSTLLQELNAGVFEQQISRALSDAAANVIATGKKGSVTITFELSQIGETSQVTCAHKLAYVVPTTRGKRSEELTTKTPLHVGTGGKLSLFPHESGNLFPTKEAV